MKMRSLSMAICPSAGAIGKCFTNIRNDIDTELLPSDTQEPQSRYDLA